MKPFFAIPSLIFAASLMSVGAHAGDLSVVITDTGGKPVKDAVVSFTPAGGASLSAADRKGPFVMAQKNVQFTPYVLAVPVGATVDFPNLDRVNHHVYSFSPVQPFQFPLYGKGKSHSQTFNKAGTEALGCNIHDSMSAYIRVVATPYYATTDATGRVTLKDLPETAGSLSVWQPLMEGADHEIIRAIAVGKTNTPQTFTAKVRQMAPMSGSY